jgi:hypothetical protein
MVFPVWDLDEVLLHARHLVRPRMTEDQVKDRYAQVGGVPSHVYASDDSFEGIVQRHSAAIRHLAPRDLQRLAVEPQSLLAAFDEARPESSLIGYRLGEAAEDDVDGTFSRYIGVVLAARAVGNALAEAVRVARPTMASAAAAAAEGRPSRPEAAPRRRRRRRRSFRFWNS